MTTSLLEAGKRCSISLIPGIASISELMTGLDIGYTHFKFFPAEASGGIKALKSIGYKLAFTTESGWSNKDQGIYKLHRVYVSNNHDMNEFIRRLTNSNYDTSN